MAFEPNGCSTTINLRLLEELQADAALAFAELGRRVGLSAPAVAERLGRLERDGVITRLPRRRSTRARSATRWPRSSASAPRRARSTKVARARRATRPRSSSATASPARTASSCACTCATSSTSRQVIDRFTPYGQTTTSIMQSSPVPRRALPLD